MIRPIYIIHQCHPQPIPKQKTMTINQYVHIFIRYNRYIKKIYDIIIVSAKYNIVC